MLTSRLKTECFSIFHLIHELYECEILSIFLLRKYELQKRTNKHALIVYSDIGRFFRPCFLLSSWAILNTLHFVSHRAQVAGLCPAGGGSLCSIAGERERATERMRRRACDVTALPRRSPARAVVELNFTFVECAEHCLDTLRPPFPYPCTTLSHPHGRLRLLSGRLAARRRAGRTRARRSGRRGPSVTAVRGTRQLRRLPSGRASTRRSPIRQGTSTSSTSTWARG